MMNGLEVIKQTIAMYANVDIVVPKTVVITSNDDPRL